MTNDNHAESLVHDRTSDNRIEKEPFNIVLVDIKRAAFKKEIHCVKKPLTGTEELKFIALSYRWGEVQETMVDTHVGYVAKMTSFDLESFFLLCSTMIREGDLKAMDYVWVDAICMDQDPQKRKETIYQMSNIYEQATFIVAVPDLHLRYLRDVNKRNAEIINNVTQLSYYMYHLVHGHTEKLAIEDEYFLNFLKIDDPHLRYLLTNYTEHFADGLMNGKNDHASVDDADDALTHLFEANAAKYLTPPKHHRAPKIYKKLLHWMGSGSEKKTSHKDDLDKQRFAVAHQCHTPEACPFDRSHDEETAPNMTGGGRDGRQLAVLERSRMIRQSVAFMTDLIRDWSTRVWVISEYQTMAQRRRKMKYWFLQLTHPNTGLVSSDSSTTPVGDDGISHVTFGCRHPDPDPDDTFFFFEFDFNDDASRICPTNAVYQTFHSTMRQQLTQRTFLEMILKSRASRDEDRLHAILPLSEYKHKLTSQDQTGVDSLVSVKLQLYEWMNTKHKLELLFLSSRADYLGKITPTFATSRILWPDDADYPMVQVIENNPIFALNFDVTGDPVITLSRHGRHQLNIKPLEYHVDLGWHNSSSKVKQNMDAWATLCGWLGHDLLPNDTTTPDVICIPSLTLQGMKHAAAAEQQRAVTHFIYLIGSLAENKWILKDFVLDGFCGCISDNAFSCQGEWEHCICDKASPGFDIY